MDQRLRRMTVFTMFALVLLRTSIGWHFLYEGLQKIDSHRDGRNPWTSEGYLLNATGPFREDVLRIAVPGYTGIPDTQPEAIAQRWRGTRDRAVAYYEFSEAQRGIADASTEAAVRALEEHFAVPENRERLVEYNRAHEAWLAKSREDLLTHERNELALEEERLAERRSELLAPVLRIESDLEKALRSILTPQQAALGALPAAPRSVRNIDNLVMWGLTVVGLGLMLGLFSRLSALGAIGFLAMFYLAYPPWPWLPPNPIAEGKYLFVDKNLVELVACLVLATVPTGKWIGVDAMLGKLLRGGRAKPSAAKAGAKPSGSAK